MPEDSISIVIPTMRYSDAQAAIDWLCDAFGFPRHLVVEDGEGGVAHGQLRCENGIIMLGSARDGEFGHLQLPAMASAAVTQSPHIVVFGIDEHDSSRQRGTGWLNFQWYFGFN